MLDHVSPDAVSHRVAGQPLLCLAWAVMCFVGGVALERDLPGGGRSYAFKAGLQLLASPKSSALPLQGAACRNKGASHSIIAWGCLWE